MTEEEELEYAYSQACIGPHDIHEHMPTLRRYATGCQHVTEMGVRYVVSTWALLAARPKRMVSYDIVRSAEVDNLERIGRAVCYFEFRMEDTTKVDIEPTDLLFIDTLHTYEQLKIELDRHSLKVAKYILLHDTTIFGETDQFDKAPGLWKAVEEFIALGVWRIKERYENNNGLTVLERVTLLAD